MKTVKFFCFLAVSIFFIFWGSLYYVYPQIQDETLDRGILLVGGKTYSYENKYDEVTVSDEHENVVFQAEVPSLESVIIGVGHSRCYNSFVAFMMEWRAWDDSYQLVLITQDHMIPLITDSKTPFYSPVFVEYHGTSFVSYITESLSIQVMNIDTGEMVNEVFFDAPVFDLRKDLENGYLRFFLYDGESYSEHGLKISEMQDSEPGILHLAPESSPDDFQSEARLPSADVQEYDYRKIIGFGDSITYGWVAAEEAPELGYIPRLQLLVDLWLYEAEVINEGRPATKTTDAILVFESVIESRQAKFLLFHYGTNDAIRLKIPVTLTLFNITEMMSQAQDHFMLPVLSTLIPRDPAQKFGQGVFQNRAVKISDGIMDIGEGLGIPVIDFYTLFGEFPEGRGGYYSLMSDRVHPSQAGYQLMAWKWFDRLTAMPPAVPSGVQVDRKSPFTFEANWLENKEPNFYYYQLEYGYDPNDLDHRITSWSNTYTFTADPYLPPLKPRLYFRIQAVNNLGIESDFCPVIELEFGK